MNEAQNDFLKLIGIFLLGTMGIALCVPIGKVWAIVCLILLLIGWCFQLYWNKHFKN